MADTDAANPRARRTVTLVAVVAAVGGLLFGYDTGIIGSALLFIEDEFRLSDIEQGAITAAVPIGAAFGATLAGGLSDRYGRNAIVLGGAVLFIVGSIVSGVAGDALILGIARFILGLAVGLASATCPVYISEVAPADKRGGFVTLFQLAITVGILVAYLVGLAFEPSADWRAMLALGAVPAIILGLGFLRLPQSPRWLAQTGRVEEARATLTRIREGGKAEADVEIEQITTVLAEEGGGSWSELLKPAARAALVVGVGLAVLQQVTGINTVIYYAPTIMEFAGAGSQSAAILASVGVGVVNVIATIAAIYLLQHRGRRPLLLVGVTGMVIALVVLGLGLSVENQAEVLSVVEIGSVMLYVAAFAISLGPIVWLINAEIYPARIRGKAAGLATTSNWVSNFVISLTFLPLIAWLGKSGAFYVFAGIGVLTVFFIARMVPETRNKSLEEIQAIFKSRA